MTDTNLSAVLYKKDDLRLVRYVYVKTIIAYPVVVTVIRKSQNSLYCCGDTSIRKSHNNLCCCGNISRPIRKSHNNLCCYGNISIRKSHNKLWC